MRRAIVAAVEELRTKQGEAEKLLIDLNACILKKDLQWGKRLQAAAIEGGYISEVSVLRGLTKMYVVCGNLVDACKMFDSIKQPDEFSWNHLLLGYAEHRKGAAALDLFWKMKSRGYVPSSSTYVAVLKACTSLLKGDGRGKEYCLERGREIHSEIGCNLDLYVQTTLIDMYAKCGSMVEAHRVFDSIQKPTVASWNALLMGYAENGEGAIALRLLSTMKSLGNTPSYITYIAALKACTSSDVKRDGEGLQRGREIHLEVSCRLTHHVQSTLIDMYANYGLMEDAYRVFEGIEKPNVVSWSALLLGYAENGEGSVALALFSNMKAQGCLPNSVTYIAVLKACATTGALGLGRKLHSEIREYTTNIVSCIVYFYAKCGSMAEAREVFDAHSRGGHVPTWNALLAGYGGLGDTASVFNLFEVMHDLRIRPDAVTFVCLLLCCSHAGLVDKAREYLEGMPVQYGVTPTLKHYNCMVDVLGRANQLNEATALLWRMSCKPDEVTWTALLGACRRWKNVEIGRLAFQSLIETGTYKVVSAHVLMANIYRSRGMWEEQERLLKGSHLDGRTSDFGVQFH